MEITTDVRADFMIPLQPSLISRARSLTGNDADARDLVQDTLERGLRAVRAPTNEAELRPWLLRIMTHLWIDRVRAMKVRRCVPWTEGQAGDAFLQEDTSDSGTGQWQDLSLVEITTALSAVPEPFRGAFRRHVLERTSYADVAREMGIRPSTVGTRVLRARHFLRRILETRLRDQACAALC